MDYPDFYTCPERGKLKLRGSAWRDLDAMARVDRLSFDEPLTREQIKQRTDRGWGYVIEAERQNDAVAYLIARRARRGSIRIDRVAVHPAFRRIGLATWLLAAQCGVLRKDHEQLVTALVPEHDTPAQLLLRKAGFFARGMAKEKILMSMSRDEWIGSRVIDRLGRGEIRVLDVV